MEDSKFLDGANLSGQVSDLVKKLAEKILNPLLTETIGDKFPSLIPTILRTSNLGAGNKNKNVIILKMTVGLSKLVCRHESAIRFAETFFTDTPSPLKVFLEQHESSGLSCSDEPATKRQKRNFNPNEITIEFLKSILIVMKVLPRHIYSSWDLDSFMTLLNSGNEKIIWLTVHCIGLMLSISDEDLKNLKRKLSIPAFLDEKLALEFQLQYERLCNPGISLHNQDNLPIQLPNNAIMELLPKDGLLSIGGILVSSHPSDSLQFGEVRTDKRTLIKLESTISYLREIALTISAKFRPICLMGSVGVGKSCLLSYIASLFGKQKYPNVISVQMSDQIDSRLLLGSYHSTDLPGQFVWKPGCLTRAVLRGHWLILEDLDSAPVDILALLSGLIDTRKLMVPGFGEISNIHPDFRILATSRTQTGKRTDKLGKRWKKLVIQSLSETEMKILISTYFPHLKPILERLLCIFQSVGELNSASRGRIVSLRDFLKFCRRIPSLLDFSKTSSAILIFQEALDLFAASFPSSATKQEIVESLGTHLGLLKAKTEYFCTQYKPHISICNDASTLTTGRFTIPMFKDVSSLNRDQTEVYSLTRRASCLMEMICGSVKNHEPVLLIGETGVGKTSCVQYLSKILHQRLVVVNLNRQSDSGDLLGGYKPVELKFILAPIRNEFEMLFGQTFSRGANKKFMYHIMTCFANRRWFELVKLMIHVQKEALTRCTTNKGMSPVLFQAWTTLGHKLSRIEMQVKSGEESPFAFSFIEGTLISAIQNGHWILLDEINLATPEMLQSLSGILDEDSDIHLWEKGDDGPIQRNANFHLFAAMNPSTDIGKKDLPLGLRNRFTEFYVEELTDPNELQVLVSDYLRELCLPASRIESIVEFYLKIRAMSHSTLVDGTGKKPHFSLRTLCRALKISALNLYGSVSRSLFESFCLSFLTQLDFSSHPVVQAIIAKFILGKEEVKSIINQPLPCPPSGKFVQVEGYWIPMGDIELKEPQNYILTSSIRRNLKDLARIVSAGKLPVLIQGETSVGKTSLIQYLASVTGNNCFRINNHQHTDLQEYAGSYQSDENGKLVFTEGVLVQAMRRGEWIILDELNLAPSEVMEALNRLLDDNRQLFIAETGQTVPAHPRFMLFATQNPPGLYGGRKLLSRAFRNRFVELHFDEIPSVELETILHLRCAIPQSYCKKIIGVLRELQMRRRSSAALEGKHGFATLRDLFRWAERYRQSGEQTSKFYDWDQHLADEGYLVLAGKVRKSGERELIREVLQKHLKRTVDPNNLFSLHEGTSSVTKSILEHITHSNAEEFKHIVWTFQMRQLAVLVGQSLKFKEPVLIVGETGCGKTTIVQLLAKLFEQTLYSVNCHMHSEGSDFLGGLRPVRNHQTEDERLFEWVNGPLVEAMENGGVFLADEISLADDSVLERVNSVLEPERTLLIAEKGDETPVLVVAHNNFHFIGTMNPGGDYGKKELSPALRNRLTEIWCEVSSDQSDLEAIIKHNLNDELENHGIPRIMTKFVSWLKNNELGHRCTISIRDYLAWVEFINHSHRNYANIISMSAIIHHGACLGFLDGLGSGTTSTENLALSQNVKSEALSFLRSLTINLASGSENDDPNCTVIFTENTVGIGPFNIPKSQTIDIQGQTGFDLEAPTTSQNCLRVLRAMQLNKPILLEGSPGVGKTALVSALAQLCGYSLIRINLSEQTDISDLFGADLPVEGATGGHFAWRDGPLLQALKNSSWILLDELNLASQSVLEGLNACLDHRGEIYVPELNRNFKIGNTGKVANRIIGCQNPVRQGGARKGLPKSFLNRFTQVFMDPLDIQDLQCILQSSFPILPKKFVQVMCHFADAVTKAVCQLGLFGAKGSPWDFNLRDLIRWSQLIVTGSNSQSLLSPNVFVDLIYGLRMRSAEDRRKVEQLYRESTIRIKFDGSNEAGNILRCGTSGYQLLNNKFICGHGILIRGSECGSANENRDNHVQVLQKQLPALEGLTICLQMGWMPILIGQSGAGKTSLIKLLGHLSGHKVLTMTVSPEMDTIDLLGGFEQADIYRKIDETSSGLREMIRCLVKGIVCQMGNKLDLMDSQLLDLWSSIQSLPQLAPEGEVVGHEEEMERLQSRVDFLQTSHSRCKSLLDEMRSRKSESQMIEIGKDEDEDELTEFQSVKQALQRLSKELKHIWTHLKSGIQTGAFQWVDSLLIKAIVSGDWLLIDGANRCSAAVLDRLNSLVEPNGSLFLSERGSIDGQIVQIRPHPNFRLILAVDPAFGEISRAMRNRGVEIFMPGPEEEDTSMIQNDDGGDGSEFTSVSRVLGLRKSLENEEASVSPRCFVEGMKPRINLFDLDSILRAEGITDPRLRDTLINLHEQIHQTVASYLGGGDRLTVHHLVESVRSFVLEMKHGVGTQVSDAIRNSIMSTYVLGNSQLIDSQLRRSQIESILKNVNFDLRKDDGDMSRLTLCMENFLNDQLYRVWKHLEVIMNIFSAKPLPPIDNILINSRDQKLLQELVLTGAFLRLRAEDAQVFVSALSIKIKKLVPEQIMNSCVAMSETLSSLSNPRDENFPWELQWSPHYLASSRRKLSLTVLKVSLRIHYHLFMRPRGTGIPEMLGGCWKPGTLGFISQAVSRGTFSGESMKNTQFLANFFSLVENFDRILLFDLKRNENPTQVDPSTLLNCAQDQAQLWRDGMSSFLWRQRLLDLCDREWNVKKNNEKLDSNVTLVIMWIGEHVVNFLRGLCPDESRADELKQLGIKCLDNIDYFSGDNREALRKGHLMREILQHKPFEVKSEENSRFLSAIFELCFEIWSLTSHIPPKTIILILNAPEGADFHTIITRIMTKVASGNDITEEDRVDLIKVNEELTRLRSLEEAHQQPTSEIVKLKSSLAALQEYIRIRNNGANSSFANPLLSTWTQNKYDNESHLKHYLSWEDRQRFLSMFTTDTTYGHELHVSSLLPHFVSKIILEDEDAQEGFRISSLGSRVSASEVMTAVNSILTKEITRPLKTEQMILKTMSQVCSDILEKVKSVLGPECQNWIAELKTEEDGSKPVQDIARLGSIMVKSGAAMMEVSTYMPLVDPAVEKEIFAGYLNSEIIFFETWLQAQQIYQFVEIGSDLYESNLETLHPHLSACANYVRKCYSDLVDAQSGIAFRPDPPNYAAIRNEILQFVKAFASVDKMKEMVDRVLDVVQSVFGCSWVLASHDIDAALIPCQIWIVSHLNFVRKLAKEFWYWDVTSSFLFASVQVSTGLSLLCDAMYRIKTSSLAREKTRIFKNLEFPVEFSLNKGYQQMAGTKQNFSNKLFASTLISFMNEVEINQGLSYSVIKKLHDLTSDVNSLWIIQEEEKQRKLELEEEMYIYKGQERSMELSEEDQDTQELANTFPSFEDEFHDVEASVSNRLEGSLHMKDKKKTERSSFNEALTRENITIFLKIHARILNGVKTHWTDGLGNSKHPGVGEHSALDFVTPFLNHFEVGSMCLNNFKYNTIEDEHKYTTSAMIAVHNLNANYEPADFFRATQLYDFYHDPNFDEVQKLNSILSGLRKRVNELLAEWPDHPSLQKIIEVIDRIETFKIDSSLMKFLTGLELLLGFAQEWESCAHQGVSIVIYLTEITELIITWRKLELQCWKNLMAITFQKEQAECHKWWFHLYSVVIDAATENKVSTNENSSDFVGALHKFIESSPIGQFETRLSLLYRIHCHLISMEQFDPQRYGTIPDVLHSYIWNTICYYNQFSEAVAVKLKDLGFVTEKKLKDFVKISRWNDANYYALKDSVQKSQRTLAKLVKEYKKALQTPVTSVLVADLSTSLSTQDIKKYKDTIVRPLKIAGFLTPSVWRETCQVDSTVVEMLKLNRFKRLRKFYDKIQGIIQTAIKSDSILYSEEIGKVEELTGTIIETSHELQNLEVSEQVHAKRKKLLHNIHARRRFALADLFKALQEAKLSYRGGLIRIKASQGKVLRDFSIDPVDITAGWKHLSGLSGETRTLAADKDLLSSWKGCENYFQKCISRIAVMMKAFQNPSKELGPSINDRCKGFIADLTNLTVEQKKQIAIASKNIWSLKIITSKCCPVKGSISLKVLEIVRSEACRIEYEAMQSILLVDSMTKSGLDDYQRIKENLNWIIEKSEKIKNQLKIHTDSIYISIFSLSPIVSARPEAAESLELCLEHLQEIQIMFETLGEDSIMGQSFSKMGQKVKEFLQRPNEEQTKTPNPKMSILFKKKMSKLLKEILLVFQNLDQYKTKMGMEGKVQDENENQPPRLSSLPVPEMNFFNSDNITNRTNRILKILEEIKSEDLGRIFEGIIPLLTQFTLTGQFYLTILVQFHRATCKLLSVLTEIFSTLGSKGFCLPADYEEEAVTEGKDMDAKSGMGLGEGETTPGAQDVSDRMESEDQLEDTLKAGESIEPADKDLDDEDKGVEMSEDFDGKMQDMEKKGGDKDSDDSASDKDSGDEEELDKQMGDIDDPMAEKLDDQMWGGSSDEDDEDLDEKEKDKGKGSAQDQVQEMGAKDPSLEEAESDTEEKSSDQKDKEPKRKEINEQEDDDTEVNDDQTDPYHGQAQPEEEPEPLDLPDDLNLDNAEPNEKEDNPENNENPFDLDKCDKIDEIPEEKDMELEDDKEPDPHEISGDENDLTDNADKNLEFDPPDLENEKDQDKGIPEEILGDLPNDENEKIEDVVQDNKSEEQKKEDRSEPSEQIVGQDQDQTSVESENANAEQQKQQPLPGMKVENSSKQDESASGQAESKDGSGHEGAKIRDEQNKTKPQNDETRKDVTRKPGETDENRTLIEDSVPQTANRLKAIQTSDDKQEENSVDPEESDPTAKDADLFQHIKDSQTQDAMTVDNATEEQADQQKSVSKPENEESKNPEMDESMELESDTNEASNPEIMDSHPELQNELHTKKDKNLSQKVEDIENMDVDVAVEGETVLTLGAQRPNTSTIETRLDLLEEWSREKAAALENPDDTSLEFVSSYMSSAEESAALVQWHELDSKTLHLAQELCEQLRLILEPTQAARLKGDYKTGKRLNMRKVIPYIASGFRKDKIWLRRTQPSKREYQILLALDDSASMADNQSKQMAFSAVAVVARSLGLLEAGQLAVVSFGEDCKLLHPFEEPFTDFSGARLMQRFTFSQRRTRIAQLLKSTSNLFAQAKENQSASSASMPELAQLLLIISDGRGVCHEGSETVKNAIRLIREQNIFVVFIIVDNPENKDSILDIRLPIFGNNSVVEIAKYMDYFPFPFYLILRDLNALPSVLSDALRQWFELVTSSER